MRHAFTDSSAAPLEKAILLVCAGSGRGRVPLAMVSRKCASAAMAIGDSLSFESRTRDGPTWRIRIRTRDEKSAVTLADALHREEIYSLSPDDYNVRTIVFRRVDWGEEPKWIGGDISGSEVDSTQCVFGGNNVYSRKDLPNQRPLRMAVSVMPTAEQPARQPAAHRRS
jgi:hypothetical protein